DHRASVYQVISGGGTRNAAADDEKITVARRHDAFSYPTATQGLAEQLFLERKLRQHFAALRRHQNLMLELDAFLAAGGANIALDADRHILLEHSVEAVFVGILAIVDGGILVAQADAVGQQHVTVRDELV